MPTIQQLVRKGRTGINNNINLKIKQNAYYSTISKKRKNGFG